MYLKTKMELKTLKDLNIYQCLEDYPLKDKTPENILEFGVIDIIDLKQEAIKELKAINIINEGGWDSFEQLLLSKKPYKQLLTISEYIKWKNNITDEDLK